MNAEQYLNEALSGNMNLSALKPYISAGLLACHEIMEGYARHKLAEAHPQADNSRYATALWNELSKRCPAKVPEKTDWLPVTRKRLNAAVRHCA
jgi:hypothetical protein